ncbi:UNVERIFIED_CONTAM: putative endonuclease distantly related to archaeal Holliday junction resolvase [Acetivibrio alkalicellulosi]
MYKQQINIIFDPKNDSYKKGAFFEDIIANVFKSQRYRVKERVNFTGMEIDLIAEHKDRNNELIYIECKAKESLESKDIKSFAFNTKFQSGKFGYFLSITDYAHQVAGLIDEMSKKTEYDNLYFFGPSKIIELLEESKFIKKVNDITFPLNVAKSILVYSFFGIYRIFIFNEYTISNKFTVFNAKDNEIVDNEEILLELNEYIDELKDLEFVNIQLINLSTNSNSQDIGNLSNKIDALLETVAEVKQSDNWYDYLPTSSKHFVGRKDLLKEFSDFMLTIVSKTSSKRVFYIDGKSGWGKSSLIATIRDTIRNNNNKNQYYIFAVDTRSASTNNFIALAFTKMVSKAYNDGFLTGYNYGEQLNIISSFDILGSDSVNQLINYLKIKNKYLVIIFDQFEDVFRKSEIFKVFYKFLNDINNACSNIVLGFSWKSEINIPIGHEAYYLWQNIKSETLCIHMREFDSKEVIGVINQLQNSIKVPLDTNIKRRIIEGSQGFPWLTKKLCIHTYNQIKSGQSVEKLIEQELNIKALFEKDVEGLSPQEIKSLRYIAQRAYDGNIFDATEIDEYVDNQVLTALIYKRLVIQSGPKYNIYWDIFRDYLVTDEIPLIGESYILRQSPNTCLQLFLAFSNKERLTVQELSSIYSKPISEKSIDNILRELINFGLISKEGESLKVNCSKSEVSKEYFIRYLQTKFERYTPFLKIKGMRDTTSVAQIEKILQDTFKGNTFKNATWEIYTKTFISWISFLGLNNFDELDFSFHDKNLRKFPNKKTKDQLSSFTPQKPIMDNIVAFKEIISNTYNFEKSNTTKLLYDLSAIGLLYYWGNNVMLNKTGKELSKINNEYEFIQAFCEIARKPIKIEKAIQYIKDNNITKIKEFKLIAENLVENINSKAYKTHTLGKIFNWAMFIISNEK